MLERSRAKLAAAVHRDEPEKPAVADRSRIYFSACDHVARAIRPTKPPLLRPSFVLVLGVADNETLRNGKVSEDSGKGARKPGWFRSDDPRVTTIGAFIRRTSIDELPQLFNVLRGEMSLVGPRPPIPYEVRHYEPDHLVRLAVCPGLTGIWQVYGRNKVEFEIMVYMDKWYIENRSLYLDLKLIALTVPVVILARAR